MRSKQPDLSLSKQKTKKTLVLKPVQSPKSSDVKIDLRKNKMESETDSSAVNTTKSLVNLSPTIELAPTEPILENEGSDSSLHDTKHESAGFFFSRSEQKQTQTKDSEISSYLDEEQLIILANKENDAGLEPSETVTTLLSTTEYLSKNAKNEQICLLHNTLIEKIKTSPQDYKQYLLELDKQQLESLPLPDDIVPSEAKTEESSKKKETNSVAFLLGILIVPFTHWFSSWPITLGTIFIISIISAKIDKEISSFVATLLLLIPWWVFIAFSSWIASFIWGLFF